jgi:hypothetical protein
MPAELRLKRMTRLVALWVAALALGVKMLVAPGLMPVVDSGGIRITLCTGAGPIEATLDIDGDRHGKQAPAAQDGCPFGALGLGVLAAGEPRFDAPALAPFAMPEALPPLPPRAPPAAPPPPATGPPAFV